MDDCRRLDETELSFSAVYICDTEESRDQVFKFARDFARCHAMVWWVSGDETTILLLFDTAIPVHDCACFFSGQVDASLFYAPSSSILCGDSAGHELVGLGVRCVEN